MRDSKTQRRCGLGRGFSTRLERETPLSGTPRVAPAVGCRAKNSRSSISADLLRIITASYPVFTFICHVESVSYRSRYRPSAQMVIGFCGLVVVATVLSSCSGGNSSTAEVGLVLPSSSTENLGGGAGPQTPPCGIFEVTKNEVVSGQQFPAGRYQINTFGISCDEVMGDAGLFSQFLQLEDDEALPDPWRFLEGAMGAPKFVSGPAVGFRVQRISD